MPPLDRLWIPYEAEEWGRFQHVGKFDGGKQFMAFVTGAFPGDDQYPAANDDRQESKQWVAVLHTFDEDGNHLSSATRLGGPDIEGNAIVEEKASSHLEQMLNELGLKNAVFGDIYVRPFSVELDGVTYELVYECETNKEGAENECVMLWPNDIMFHPPWDSGEYST